MEEAEAQLQQLFSACESGSSTSSRTLSEGEDTATDAKVCGDAGADCRNFQTEEGKCNAEDHHHDDHDDEEGSDEDEDEKVKKQTNNASARSDRV